MKEPQLLPDNTPNPNAGNATIVSLTDYHEFGMTMQKRTAGSGTYRFQYQGSEQDREITNGNNSNYTTDFRGLDVRLGRWLSPDPIRQPSWSPYNSMRNNPIANIDPLGLKDHGFNPTKERYNIGDGNFSNGSVSAAQGGAIANAFHNLNVAGQSNEGGAAANPSANNPVAPGTPSYGTTTNTRLNFHGEVI